MNPEILKQIVAAVNSMAGNAKEAFGYYLLAAYGVDLLKFILGWVGGITLAWVTFSQFLSPLIASTQLEMYFKSIRDKYNLGSGGPLSVGELNRIRQKIESAFASSEIKSEPK